MAKRTMATLLAWLALLCAQVVALPAAGFEHTQPTAIAAPIQLAIARALAAMGRTESAYAYQNADAAFARVVPASHPYRRAIVREHQSQDLPYTSEAPW